MVDSFSGEYRWLSNFYPVTINYEGYVFRTVEHAYQALKCKFYHEFLEVKNCETPGQAKRSARQKVMRDDWDKVKVSVMFYLLQQKFSNPHLWSLLVATGDQPIVEGNQWGDTFWGVCRGKGENHLGKMIMAIRAGQQHYETV